MKMKSNAPVALKFGTIVGILRTGTIGCYYQERSLKVKRASFGEKVLAEASMSRSPRDYLVPLRREAYMIEIVVI